MVGYTKTSERYAKEAVIFPFSCYESVGDDKSERM